MLKSDALLKWNESQGYVKGRKWSSQRLPVKQIEAIRKIAGASGSPSQAIEAAFLASPFRDDYQKFMNSFSVESEGQAMFEFA